MKQGNYKVDVTIKKLIWLSFMSDRNNELAGALVKEIDKVDDMVN
jgi:hypothetical protein